MKKKELGLGFPPAKLILWIAYFTYDFVRKMAVW